MESPAARPVKSRKKKETGSRFSQGALYQLGMVFIVASVLATLFTAWTPGQYTLLPTPNGMRAVLAPSPTLPSEAEAETPEEPSGPPVIGIVAGHWKNDSGAICPDGLEEAQVNLNIASKVQKILADQGYHVDLMAEFDLKLTDYRASALVSVHADSCNFINNEAYGFKVASAMATRHPERAARLTACIRSRYGIATGKPLHSTSVTPDMTSYHAFGEIDENTPAAIIETGFLNLDRELLTQHPDTAAQGIADGILCYIKNESVTPPTGQPPIDQPTTLPPTAPPP